MPTSNASSIKRAGRCDSGTKVPRKAALLDRTRGLRWVPMLAVLAVACTGSEAAEPGSTTATSAAEPASETASAATPSAPAVAAAPAVADTSADVAPKVAPRIASLDAQPIAAGDLRDAYFHWNQATVTVGGYLSSPFADAYWSTRVNLTAAPDKDAPQLVDCALTQAPSGKVPRDTPVVVRGTFTGRSFAVPPGAQPTIALRPCDVVSVGEPFGDGGDPWTVGPTPVAAGKLHEAVFGWQGKRVQVTGYYNGSTHSSASNTTEHDIEDGNGKDAVGCVEPGNAKAPASAVEQRAGVVVEGVIAEPVFDRVVLRVCRFVTGEP